MSDIHIGDKVVFKSYPETWSSQFRDLFLGTEFTVIALTDRVVLLKGPVNILKVVGSTSFSVARRHLEPSYDESSWV